MKKGLILLFIAVGILISSAEKLNKMKKKSFDVDDQNYADIIESVHSDTLEVPQIKIRLANAEEEDDDATISMDFGREEDDDQENLRRRRKKLSKSKTDDIHSFL